MSNTLPLIQHYFPELNDEQLNQLKTYAQLLENWNQKVNLISRKDFQHFEERHLLHSLAIAKKFAFKPGTKIIDVGTGGGLPGIPLSIYFPQVSFLLVDSIGKKIHVVDDCISQLHLQNAAAVCSRMEQLKGPFDFVTNRAVADIKEIYRFTKHLISARSLHTFKNGIIGLKGEVVHNEARSLKGSLQTWNVTDLFSEPFFENKVVYHFTVH